MKKPIYHLVSLAYLTVAIMSMNSCSKEGSVLTTQSGVAGNEVQLSEGEGDVDEQEGLSLFDTRIRSIDANNYVLEAFVIDFSNQMILADEVTLDNDELSILMRDDGQGNDAVANDGIYTSVETRPHTSQVPFTQTYDPISIQEQPVVLSTFQYETELFQAQQAYGLRPAPDPDDEPSYAVIYFPEFGWKCGAWACCCHLEVVAVWELWVW